MLNVHVRLVVRPRMRQWRLRQPQSILKSMSSAYANDAVIKTIIAIFLYAGTRTMRRFRPRKPGLRRINGIDGELSFVRRTQAQCPVETLRI